MKDHVVSPLAETNSHFSKVNRSIVVDGENLV